MQKSLSDRRGEARRSTTGFGGYSFVMAENSEAVSSKKPGRDSL